MNNQITNTPHQNMIALLCIHICFISLNSVSSPSSCLFQCPCALQPVMSAALQVDDDRFRFSWRQLCVCSYVTGPTAAAGNLLRRTQVIQLSSPAVSEA